VLRFLDAAHLTQTAAQKPFHHAASWGVGLQARLILVVDCNRNFIRELFDLSAIPAKQQDLFFVCLDALARRAQHS
jgi:hypothetical protein